MEISFLVYPVIFLASFVLSMAGLGGGLVFAPLFVLIGFGQTPAVASSLLLNALGASTASYVYIRSRLVDFSLSIPLIITSGLAAPVGALVNNMVDQKYFMLVLSLVILAAGLRMLIASGMQPGSINQKHVWSMTRLIQSSLMGLIIGFIGGMLGIGGGVFVVPLLVYFLHVHPKTAAATTAFIVCFSSFAGFFTHAAMEALDWKFLILAGLFSSAGGLLGSRLMSTKLSGNFVKRLFGVILLFLSIYLFYRGILS
ncbi:sulfite exporter TauE/SafE family protein [Desulfonatronovibrio hydrogenovorans]|uniref:sulfite exporter TauE/SafE family protein n=1 Tax=Desulfonatronovibrio hydrogenovorans TaxID=53245 RepID=UPI000A02ED29|nr:sulfite exporter TauE/SafE family protein [Desulfonatronovibrio hydrogenovorans]